MFFRMRPVVRWASLFAVISALLLMSSILVYGDSPDIQSAPTPTMTPDPTVEALQKIIATQQIDLDSLQRDLENSQKDLDDKLRDVQWDLDYKLAVAAVILAVTGFLGFRTYQNIDEKIRQRINATLEKELYQLDPTMLTINVREGTECDPVVKRLQMSGLKNIRRYADFSDKTCRKGVTIVPITCQEDEDEFAIFIENTALEPTRAAFVLYAPNRQHPVSDVTRDSYANLATANMPTTAASAVLVVGRGLRAE